MMLRILVFLSLLVALHSPSQAASSALNPCIGNLILDHGAIVTSDWSSLALIRMVEETTSNANDADFDIGVPIDGLPIQGAFQQASQASRHSFQHSSLDWTHQRLVSVATQTLSDNAVSAYRTCVEGQRRTGLFVTVHDATNSAATVTIRWIARNQAEAKSLVSLEVTHTGGRLQNRFPSQIGSSDVVERTFLRNAHEDMRIVVNISSDAGRDATDEFVSMLPENPPDSIPVDTIGMTLWGGAYDLLGSECVSPNPATQSCVCPDGYNANDMSDAGLVICLVARDRSTPIPMHFIFGGAYDPRGSGCAAINPLTSSCSCPSGFRDLDLADAGVVMCYAMPGSKIHEYLKMAGSFDTRGDACAAGNIAHNGSCGCPSGYNRLDLSDAGITICESLPPMTTAIQSAQNSSTTG